jgi:hypothetical protein
LNLEDADYSVLESKGSLEAVEAGGFDHAFAIDHHRTGRAERDADPAKIVADQKMFDETTRSGVRLQAALCALELLMP